MEDEVERDTHSAGEVNGLGSATGTTALRLREGIDNEAFVAEEENGPIEITGHLTAQRRLDFNQQEQPRLYRRNAKRFNQKSAILSRIKFRTNGNSVSAADGHYEDMALPAQCDVTNGAKIYDVGQLKTSRRVPPSGDNDVISDSRDTTSTNDECVFVDDALQDRNETGESDRVVAESSCADAEVFTRSLDFGAGGSDSGVLLNVNRIPTNPSSYSSSNLINDRTKFSSFYCSTDDGDDRISSGVCFSSINQYDLCINCIDSCFDVQFAASDHYQNVNSPVAREDRRRRSLPPPSERSSCPCFDVDFYGGNGRSGSICLCTSSSSSRTTTRINREETGVLQECINQNNRNRDSVVVAITGDQMIGCSCNAAAAENVAAIAVDGAFRGNAVSSVVPSHLLPRRHMSSINTAGIVGGIGNDGDAQQQPPPLPPARHRSANISNSNNNCCCCNSGGCHLRTLSPQNGGDRAAVGNVANNRMRRDRRPTVDEVGGEMSRPPPPPPPLPSINPHGDDGITQSSLSNNVLNPELLPDILNSHLPPPYSTLPHTNEHSSRRGLTPSSSSNVPLPSPPPPPLPPPLPSLPPPLPPLPAPSTLTLSPSSPARRSRSERFPLPRPSHRRNRGQRSTPRGTHYTPEDEPKNCCGVAVTQTVSIRWFIVMIAFVGLCCAVVGTVLGALKATGREHLTVSLLMIGVGIVLITVSGIAWRLTSHDAPSCRMMLGLHSEEPEPNRRFVPRVPPSYGRPHHPYAAMMYPEFQYRPPPPSYQASMQEYRLRLLLLDRHQPTASTSHSPVSPPPTYRSNAGGNNNNNTFTRPPIHFTRESDYSRPPSYRSRASSVNPNPGTTSEGSCNPAGPNGLVQTTVAGVHNNNSGNNHSRDPSLSLSLLSHESLFDVAVPLSDRQTGCNNNSSSPQSPLEIVPVTVTTGSIVRLDPTVGESRVTRGNGNRHSMTEARYNQGPAKDNHDYAEVPMVTSGRTKRPHDCNVVTIVQTTNSSRVLGGGVSQDQGTSVGIQVHRTSPGEMEILAHL